MGSRRRRLPAARRHGGTSAGVASAVLVPTGWDGYSAPRSGLQFTRPRAETTFRRTVRDYYSPYGIVAPAQVYALLARRHMIEYGTTREALGAVALWRAAGMLNSTDKAVMRGRSMSLEDYIASPMIVDPYRRLDCCLETDAAAAVVVTTVATARQLHRHRPVVIRAVAEGRARPATDMCVRDDPFTIGLTTAAAPEVFERAGVGPEDMDFAQIYDCFTFEVIQQLEEAGFCPRGEGGTFVLTGSIELGGALPVNTHGGAPVTGAGPRNEPRG